MLEVNSSKVLLEMSSARSAKQQTSDFILILIMSSVQMFLFFGWLITIYAHIHQVSTRDLGHATSYQPSH